MDGYALTRAMKEIIANSENHTLPLKEAYEYVRFYGLRNLIKSQGDMHFVSQVAISVIDRAIENGELHL